MHGMEGMEGRGGGAGLEGPGELDEEERGGPAERAGARLLEGRARRMGGVAFCVLAGSLWGLWGDGGAGWLAGAAMAGALAGMVFAGKGWSRWLVWGAMLACAAANGRLTATDRGRANSLMRVLGAEEREVWGQMAVTVAGDAVMRSAIAGRGRREAVFEADAERASRTGRTWWAVRERVRVVMENVPEGAELPKYGERWVLRGAVKGGSTGGGSAGPRGVETRVRVEWRKARLWDAGHGNGFVRWCTERRRWCRAALRRGVEDWGEAPKVVEALLLGYREDLPAGLRADFRATGTVHIFAISGAHVGMVLGMTLGVLGWLGVPRNRWLWAAAPVLAVYTVGTGGAVSAVRASVMALMALSAPAAGRRPDGTSALLAAAALIAAANPAQVADLGFVLSFTAVAALIWLVPAVEAALRRALCGGADGGRRWWKRGARWLGGGLGVSGAAWVGTGPLTAHCFHLFSPLSLALNLAVIPVVFCILLAGVLSLALGWIGGGWVGEAFNAAACGLAGVLTGGIRWAAGVPWGHVFVRSPPAWTLAAGYGLLGAALAAGRVREPEGWRRLLLALAAGAAVYGGWWAWDAARVRVSVLDVGDGSSALVQAGRERILVDTGAEFRAEDVLRQARAQGMNRLDALVLSHGDSQHIGAAGALLEEVEVGEVWVPAVRWFSPKLEEVLARAREKGIPVREVRAGDAGTWAEGVRWEVLWPEGKGGRLGCADDGSLVLRVCRGRAGVLLAGDAGWATEAGMMAAAREGKAERAVGAPVLVAGRHGADGATGAAWLAATGAEAVVLSCRANAKSVQAADAVLERVAQAGAELWRTDLDGTVHVDFARRAWGGGGRGWRVWSTRWW